LHEIRWNRFRERESITTKRGEGHDSITQSLKAITNRGIPKKVKCEQVRRENSRGPMNEIDKEKSNRTREVAGLESQE
jgi:hypothetical protein